MGGPGKMGFLDFPGGESDSPLEAGNIPGGYEKETVVACGIRTRGVTP